MENPDLPAKPVFLIVESDDFVTEDLAEILHESVSGAQVIQATQMDSGTLELIREMSVYGVFLGGSVDNDFMRAMSEDLRSRDVRLAWIGSAGHRGVTTGPDGAQPITAPFTAQAVLSVIESWGGGREAAAE